MSAGETPEIRRLTAEMLDEVVGIHLAGMGYTLNAQLGQDHLRYLYETMSADPECYTGAAFVEGRLLGVVSGTADFVKFSTRLIGSMSASRLLRTGIHVVLHPRMIWQWLQGNLIARPIRIDSGEVRAVLTAIVVDQRIQGRGIGRALVAAFEAFLRQAGIRAYRLDTQIANRRAVQFYHDLGFVEAARRADSIIFVRKLPA